MSLIERLAPFLKEGVTAKLQRGGCIQSLLLTDGKKSMTIVADGGDDTGGFFHHDAISNTEAVLGTLLPCNTR
ncbi:hypothetical protein ACOI1H_16125 [Loktanella sp. DJP18]|uniref:hypothetical protein n=1 Tax=Loktanella sp. DJP18 TaxID=3409788 RepID=UPI003BB70ADC